MVMDRPVNRGFTRREFLSVGAMAGAGLVIMSGCGGSRSPQTGGGAAQSIQGLAWNWISGMG